MYFRNKYAISIILLLLFLATVELSSNKVDIVKWAHTHRLWFLDYFFFLFTKIGETPLIIGSLLATYFLKKPWFKYAVITIITNTIIVQSLKFGIDAPRPCWELDTLFTQVLGLRKLVSHSFPSGHSAAALLSCGVIYSLRITKYNFILFVFITCCVAYSRMYFAHHYSIDVIIGGLIGLFNYFLFLYLTQRASK